MHIPDGYISPLMSLGSGLLTVPAWAIAVRRVQAVLNHRTVPLLAIFSALAFTIMMFNIPVPGGTTAHAVGGTLIAVVLGVPAAIIGVSMALILQALFFGDGGVLAIFLNCLNMAVILPVAGYWTYRLIAQSSPVLSTRRAWAAGIGAYVGLTLSGLAVGIELGLQPLLFSEAGRPLYSPYGLQAAIPAMLISHVLGASVVEGIVTALGVAYLQKRHPEYLEGLKMVFAGGSVGREVATGARRPLWQVVAAGAAGALVFLAAAGLITGGGDPGRMFGADWGRVNWSDVAVMLIIVGALAAVLVPLVYFALPKRVRGVGAGFMALAILAPLGLIAPGFAYGEGSPGDVHAAFGYVPQGLKDLSGVFSAPLSGYNLPLPFFSDANSRLWQTAIGYEISGMLGILLVGGLVWALAALLRRRTAPARGVAAPVPVRTQTQDSRR